MILEQISAGLIVGWSFGAALGAAAAVRPRLTVAAALVTLGVLGAVAMLIAPTDMAGAIEPAYHGSMFIGAFTGSLMGQTAVEMVGVPHGAR